MIVTIDGPAGTGKTTVAKQVAERLSLPYFDTGAMYRAATLILKRYNIDLADLDAVAREMVKFQFKIHTKGSNKRYFACGIDVTEDIRSQAINLAVSQVAAMPTVRKELLKIQLAFGQQHGGVFEGRDIGTVVFPKAKYKIFLTARPEVRAQRRLEEMIAKQPHEAAGWDRDKMMQELQRRDDLDSKRAIAPLRCPDDAYVIDTSDLDINEVVEQIVEYCNKKSTKPAWLRPNVKLLYRFVLFCAWLVIKGCYRHRIYGLEHFYPRGALIAANHASFLDPPLVSISWPEPVHFLARASLFRFAIFGRLIRNLNAHPVHRGAGDVSLFRMVIQLIENGEKIVFFPEGTRTKTGALGPIKPGLGLLLSLSQAAIVPAYIHGSFAIWNTSRKLPKLWGKTVIVFGSPIRWDEFSHLEKKEAYEAVAQRWREAIMALKDWYEAGAKGVPP